METIKIKQGNEFSNSVASTIMSQFDTYYSNSWGISQYGSCYVNEMPSLALLVNGFLHKGLLFISLNEGTDTYIVRTVIVVEQDFLVKQSTNDVYCDTLSETIDAMIERSPEWTDEEYGKRVDEWLANNPI